MRYYHLLAVFCVLSATAIAQKRKVFTINPGENVMQKIPFAEQYSYPEFKAGNVYFRNETYYPAKLNFNAVIGAMQFIDPNGDTLSLADEGTIRMIVVASDTFYFDKIYLRQVSGKEKVKLAVNESFATVNRQKVGGFGELESASVVTFSSMSGSQSYKEVVAKDVLTLARYRVFYLGDRFGHFKIANRKNVADFFPGKEKELKKYLDENKVDFTSEEDLRKLLDALSEETSGQ